MSIAKLNKGFKHYFGRTLDRGEDTASFFAGTSAEPVFTTPAARAPRADDGSVDKDCLAYEEWKHSVTEYKDKQVQLKSNKTVIFSTIISHCSGGVTAKLEAETGYTAAQRDFNVVWLITQLRDICNQFEKTEDRHLALFRALSNLVTRKQHANQLTSDYYDTIIDLVDVFEAYGGRLHNPADKVLPASERAGINATTLETQMRQRAIATLLVENADEARYGDMRQQLRSSYSRGADAVHTLSLIHI